MSDNICSICFRRISAHTITEVKECTSKFSIVELERQANQECISCGVPADLLDPISNEYYCHGCLQWLTQLNDGG